MKQAMNTGAIILLVLAALLMAALLELGKNTLWGWAAAALAVLAFVLLYPRLSGRLARLLAWLGLIVCFALAALASQPPYRPVPAVSGKNPAVTEVVTVAQGQLTGVYNRDGTVEVYAGIPYAQPPLGELRWREPQAPEPWEGVRACDAFAPMSMQQTHSELYNSLYDLIGYHKFSFSLDDNFREPVSEDSLYLNIWKPAGEGEKIPVIFFIHGGSLMTGQPSFAEYRGESLAEKGVIVVNFGYRLNIFGYLACEELAAESPNGTTGNYGLLDQIAALRWVHENIAAFGGDPDNITIAGESAGSASVNALCVSPLSEGLFRRVIAESSSVTAVQPYHSFRSMEKALEMGANIREEMGVSSVEELRRLPADKLLSTSYANNAMTVDGYALTEQPWLSYDKGLNHEEALLGGFNGHEAEVFRLMQTVDPSEYEAAVRRLLGDETARYLALYPASDKKTATEQVNTLLSVCWFAYGHYDWSARMVSQGKPAYEYYFTKHNGAISDWHSGEMIYAYGNLDSNRSNYRDDDYALSEIMQRYWVNFARSGDPNGPGLPEWPQYSEAPDKVLNFDSEVKLTDDPYLPIYPIVRDYQNSLKEK